MAAKRRKLEEDVCDAIKQLPLELEQIIYDFLDSTSPRCCICRERSPEPQQCLQCIAYYHDSCRPDDPDHVDLCDECGEHPDRCDECRQLVDTIRDAGTFLCYHCANWFHLDCRVRTYSGMCHECAFERYPECSICKETIDECCEMYDCCDECEGYFHSGCKRQHDVNCNN